MAKRVKKPEPPKALTRDERAEACAAKLDGYDNLLVVARMMSQEFHDAVIVGEPYEEFADIYEAVIFRLNGNTLFGSYGGPDRPGPVVERHCSAAWGAFPSWGQSGEFLIEVEGIGVFVSFRSPLVSGGPKFDFHALDLDKPFISETGYRNHHFGSFGLPSGLSVQEVAQIEFASFLATNKKGKKPKPVYIREDCKKWRGLPAWVMEELELKPAAVPTTPSWQPPAHVTGSQLSFFDELFPPAPPEPDRLQLELEQLRRLAELAFLRNQPACDACPHVAPRVTRLAFLRAALWPKAGKDRRQLLELYKTYRLRDLRRYPPATTPERSLVS